jgi:hypothetical protein
MNAQVTEFINKAPSEQKQIMERIRQLIHESMPGITEEFKWSRPVFKAKKDFAYLQATKAHVSLGFFNFQELEDKGSRLEGTGKSMRHVKLKTVGDIDESLFKKWFKTAAK